MPLFDGSPNDAEWVEPDDVPRPVVTYGFASADFGGIELDLHRHNKGQLLLVQRGALTCEVNSGLWTVPPRSAIWIPGGALHRIKVTGALEGYGAFVASDIDAKLPASCCAVAVTPLLRELMFRAARLPLFYEEGGQSSRLLAVLLDELAAAKVEDLHLPMPSDPRLRKLVELMMASPDDRSALDVWAKRGGMSERSLLRLISRETGMSFGRWRQQLSVTLAVQWLGGGATIQEVAEKLGYESVPSFITMFRKALGSSPRRYMAERHTAPL